MKKTSLVLGAGFLGSRVASFLTKYTNVVVIDKFSKSNHSDMPVGVSVVTGNATSSNIVKTTFSRYSPDYVFVFVGDAIDADGYYDFVGEREAISGTALTIAKCLKTGHKIDALFFASSSEVYRPTKKMVRIKESSIASPSSMAGETFYSAERFFSSLSYNFNFRFVSLRYFSIFGNRKWQNPREDPVSFILNELQNESPVILCRPNERIDILHIDDAILATEIAFNNTAHKKENKIRKVNIGSGVPITLVEIYNKISSYLGSNLEPGLIKTKTTTSLISDNSLIKSLGWKHSISLDDYLETL
jgi:nucleoside-diphosphate-sugar epimerase